MTSSAASAPAAGRGAGTPEIHSRCDHGFAWTPRPRHFMQQSSAALVEDGRVWLIDPLRAAGVEEEIDALGKVAAIVMTTGWHDRSVDWFAALYGVPVYVHRAVQVVLAKTNVVRVDGAIPDTPLRFIECSGRGALSWWQEAAVWWPEQRTLFAGDCLGNAVYFVRPAERLAVHPIRRLSPPNRLGALPVERLFVGHGRGIEAGAAAEIDRALADAPHDIPRVWWYGIQATYHALAGARPRI